MSSDEAGDGDTRSRADEARSADRGDDGADDGDDGDDESEWRFSVDDVGPDGVREDTHTPDSEPIEPESIDVEHAVFVVLGVAITVGVFLVGF